MSFRDLYDDRWERIFRPAVEAVPFGSLELKAVRVDERRSGDSILTDINSGIAHAQVVLADISVTDRWTENGEPRWARNGNVMYEVGLALSCRQPVEVILLRDDSEPLLFDLSHIPVIRFDPNDADAAISIIRTGIADRLRERDLLRDLRTTALLESLSQFEINVIRSNAHMNSLGWKCSSLPAAVAMALPSLLEKRILRLAQIASNENPDLYVWTTLGRVVVNFLKDHPPRTA